jgi:tetratricopeptide (TPR) repeat protein
LQLQYGDAVAVEQFGFGFFSAVSTNSTLSLTIYGITDVINKANIDSTVSRANSIKNATAFAFEILSKYRLPRNEIVACRLEIIDEIKNSIASLNDSSENLAGDRHRQINYGRDLLKEEKFTQAYKYLNKLKDDIWDTCNDLHKHRILVNIGLSLLQTDKIHDGALKLIEALNYNKDDDKALAIAAQGFFVLEDYIRSEENINKSLEKNPNNTVAYSTRILIAPPEESIESILEKVPFIYREETDILSAMGWASLERELYEKAVFYWQAVLAKTNTNDISNIKSFLGFALLKPITDDYAIIATRQISDCQRNNLEQAIKLFDEVLGGSYLNPNELLGVKFIALSNRASSLRLVGRWEEAIRDVNIILQKDLNDSQWIKQRAFIAHESGNNVDAYKYIKGLVPSPENPDSSIFAAIYLIELDRYQDAENILDSLIQGNISADTKSEANRLKFIISIECNDQQKAQEILEQLTKEEPGKLLTIINRIQWEKKFGSEEKIPDLINQSKNLITLRSSITEKLNLSNTLYLFGYYRDAIPVYEEFVDSSINTLYSRRLLECYFNTGDYKSSLMLCKQLLEKDQSILTAAEISAYIYQEIGDKNLAHQICENYLAVDPKNIRMQLLLAISNNDKGNYEEVDIFLDSNPSTISLRLNSYKNLAYLYKKRSRTDKFLETIYDARHHFYDDIKVHSFYQISYLDVSSKKKNKDFSFVVDKCGVLVRNESNQDQWYILDSQSSSNDSAKYILNKDQILYKLLIEKQVGNKIVLGKHILGENSLEIINITDKYLAASAQSLSILATRPDVENFQVFPAPESEQDINEWVQKLIVSSQECQDSFEQIESRYMSGFLPLGAIACLFHRNPINIWNSLASGPAPFIHTWSNFKYEKIEDSIISLQKGGLVVIDMVSLLTIHHLQIMDEVVLILGEIGISQSTVDIFHCAIEETKGIQSNGFSSFSADEGYGVMQEVNAEQVAQYRESLQYILDWIKINCQILPCNRALDINQDKRRDLNKTIGSAFVDTVLIASEPNRILYSDDQWLRLYGKLEYGVCGIWTQSILKYCLTQDKINKPLYYQSVFKLISSGYSYTLIDSDILMESVRLHNWQVNPLYGSVLNAFTQNDIQHVTYVVASFLRQLYLEVIIVELIDPRDMLVLELLKILTVRFPSGIFITELRKSIEVEFRLIPIHKKNLIAIINLWASQSIISFT